MALLKLPDAISQEDTLPLCGQRLRNYALDSTVGHVDNHHRREDIMEATNNVALNDLGHDIGDKCLLLNL